MILLKKCAGHSVLFFILLSTVLPFRSAFAQELVILKVILNMEDKGEFFLVRTSENDIWMKSDEFSELSLKEGVGRKLQFDGETYISLMSVPDILMELIEEKAALDITVSPRLFKEQGIDASDESYHIVDTATYRSAYLNYGVLYGNSSNEHAFNIEADMGMAVDGYFGSSTFKYDKTPNTERLARLMTNVTVIDMDKMTTTIFGDFSAVSGPLGSGAVLGGISFARNFAVDPSFTRYPDMNLSADISTPSEVEVYLNDRLVKKESLSPGRFVFNDIRPTTGAGNSHIKIKDVYGEETIISRPFYYTTQLLKKGLHEYRYSIGFMRENLGTENFTYGKPAWLNYHNYGLSDSLTIGYSAEASKDVVNIGSSMSFLIPNAGTVNALCALSNYRGRSGASALARYSYQTKHFGTNISLSSDSQAYSTLAGPSSHNAKLQFSASAGYSDKKVGGMSAYYSYSDMYTSGTISKIVISYGRNIKNIGALSVSASETAGSERSREIFASLHVYLGRNISGALRYGNQDGKQTRIADIQKSIPSGEGYGFRSSVEHTGNTYNFDGKLGYQNQYGIYSAGYSDVGGSTTFTGSVSGGIGYIDKSIFLSKPLRDSYAKVKVGKLEGVRVYAHGNEAGRTDRNGELIIPRLLSFHKNRIEIEDEDIPINYSLSALTRNTYPPFRSGSVIEFDIAKIQAISGTMYYLEEGTETFVESAVMHVQTQERSIKGIIGMGGEFYIENVPQGTHPAKAVFKGKTCMFDMTIPDSEDVIIDLGKILCEAGK